MITSRYADEGVGGLRTRGRASPRGLGEGNGRWGPQCLMLLAVLLGASAAEVRAGEPEPAPAPDLREFQRQLNALAKEVQALRQENAELRKEVGALTAAKPAVPAEEAEEVDLEALRKAAAAELAEVPEEVEPEEKVFKIGGLGLQSLNPEISLAGDMLSYWKRSRDDDKDSDFDFRVLDIHIEGYLDPYTKFKAAIPVFEDNWTRLGEGYITRFGVLPNLNLTLGKFRQQFGVVNRWHKHALDQIDFPLPLTQIFGPGGLNQTGVALDWTMPRLGRSAQTLTFQLTDGSNGQLFDENERNTPCALIHYKNYRDLSKDTYLEFGLTGLAGANNEWDVQGKPDPKDETRWTTMGGLDLTLLWEPTDRMRYRNVEWRTEGYYLHKEIVAPDGSGNDSLCSWGAFSYLQTKLSRTIDVGLRADYYRPDDKDYAELPGLSLAPLAYAGKSAYRWQIAPYITWWQSPWVKFRLEYDHIDGAHTGSSEDRVTLQCVFAIGPHKHERY